MLGWISLLVSLRHRDVLCCLQMAVTRFMRLRPLFDWFTWGDPVPGLRRGMGL